VQVADDQGRVRAGYRMILDAEPDMPLPHALADAIRSTVGALRVMPGESPSSTVSIARRRGDEVDLLVLGDSPIYIGPDSQLLTDDRLAQLDSKRLPGGPHLLVERDGALVAAVAVLALT